MLQARREPQRGPEKMSRGPTPPPIPYVLRSRRCREGGNVGEVSPHHPTRGLGERRKLPQCGPGRSRPKMDFMHILGQKEATWNTILAHSKNELIQWRGVRRLSVCLSVYLSVCKLLRKSLLLAGKWQDRHQTFTRWTPGQHASSVCSRSRSRSKVT